MKTKTYPEAHHCLPYPVLLSLLLLLLGGCADAPKVGGWANQPSPQQIAAVMGAKPGTFLYYPRYEIYQDENTREYVYQEGQWWINSDRPPTDISVEALQRTPSVLLTLQDAPKREHGRIKAAYPVSWNENAPVVATAAR